MKVTRTVIRSEYKDVTNTLTQIENFTTFICYSNENFTPFICYSNENFTPFICYSNGDKHVFCGQIYFHQLYDVC